MAPVPLAHNTAQQGMPCRAERKAAAAAARPQELHEEWRKFRIQPARRARWKRCIAAAQLAADPSQAGNQLARTTLLQASPQNAGRPWEWWVHGRPGSANVL